MKLTVHAERVGRWWALQCVEYPGALSQVARLSQAEQSIREAIAFVADIDENSFDVDVVPVISESTREHMRNAKRLREQSAEANAQAARESRLAARELASQGLTMRDVGTVMGVSYQRAQQLIREN